MPIAYIALAIHAVKNVREHDCACSADIETSSFASSIVFLVTIPYAVQPPPQDVN